MPSIRPHLTVLRPSQTTVSFTVSTFSPQQSFAAHLTQWLLLSLRALLALVFSLILATKYFHLHHHLLGPLSAKLDLVPWLYLSASAVLALFLVFRRFHTGIISLSSDSTVLP